MCNNPAHTGAGRRSRFRTAVSGPQIVCAATKGEYRQAAGALVNSGERVLEIGSQLDETTATLADAGAVIIACDMTRKKSTSAPRCAGVELHELQIDDVSALQRAAGDLPLDVVLLDASQTFGNELPLDILSLTRRIAHHFAPRLVLVRSSSLARIARQVVAAPALLRANPPLEVPLVGHPPIVVASEGVVEYRRAALCLAHAGNLTSVLELGCHHGRSTALLQDELPASAHVIGVDVSESIVRGAREYHPKTRFEVCDGWDVRALLDLYSNGTPEPDLILVDIGGLSSVHGELEALGLLRLLCSTFPSARGLVYKSRCMKGVANLSAVSDLQIHVTKHGRTSSRRDREPTPAGAEAAAPPAASPSRRSRWTALLAVTALVCVEYALRARRR